MDHKIIAFAMMDGNLDNLLFIRFNIPNFLKETLFATLTSSSQSLIWFPDRPRWSSECFNADRSGMHFSRLLANRRVRMLVPENALLDICDI